jgi:hypothetical protein
MSSTLYKEALLEVDELKRMAEENAKNKIIEAVTPQIRRMIESQLIGEKKVDELDELITDEEIEVPAAELDMSISPPVPQPAEPAAAAPKIKIDVQGDLNIEMDDADMDDDDDLIMGQQISDVVESYIMGKRSPKHRINELSRKTRTLSKLLKTINLSEASSAQRKIAVLYYAKLLDEAVSLASSGIIIEESVDLGLLSQLKTTIKEIRQMANRRDAVAFRRLLEELEADEGLKEMMREEDAGEEAAEAVEAAEEVEADVDAAEDAAEEIKAAADDLMAALGLDDEVEVEDEVEIEDDDGDVEVSDDEEVLELGEADDKDEAAHEADDMDEVYEIDEAMLRRELLRMREGLEAEDGDPSADESDIGDPMDAQEDFGGSDEVIEVSEDDLVEALHLELNRMKRSSRRPVRESRRRRSVRNRARSRRRNVVTESSKNVKLRKQLHEMNVFNAKLLFANKLMQNRELTRKQQRAIVEALDSAKTVNEAKLLYKSLSASLKQQGGTLSESKNRLLASSSRSTRSASPAKNGVDGDRWALLAGLNGKK